MTPLSNSGAGLAFAMRAFARHWGALLALALFLTAGLAVLDDYGAVFDEQVYRQDAEATLVFLASGDVRAFFSALNFESEKFYGMAFHLPLLIAERAFGMEDYDHRAVYLLRHLVTHLFFLVGGLFAYLIVFRLFGDRLLAFAAMPMFLWHPRLYAHSFFNGQDIPFLVMFIVSLYLTHRAFRRGSLSAFVPLGAAVGVLVNLRVMGVVLLAAVLGARAFDFALARGRTERMRALLTGAAFALAAGLTAYALLPYLWADPVARVIEYWTTLSDHPYIKTELFRGASGRSVDFPEYLPVWFSITSPPFALLLGLIGAASVIAFGARRSALRDARTRFFLLLAVCFFAPILWVVVTGPNMYHGWRHAYFLWAPFSLLAVIGLRRLTEALGRERLRRAAYGAAGAGLVGVALSMALIHPNQQVSFNVLVDRATPEGLRAQFSMDYWGLAMRPTFDWILRSEFIMDNEGRISPAAFSTPQWDILPSGARAKLSISASQDALALKRAPIPSELDAPSSLALHRVKAYGNTLATIERKMDMQAVYDATRGVEPAIDSVFDLYPLENGAALVKEPCAPSFMRDLAAQLQNRFVYIDVNLMAYGAAFDGKCAALIPGLEYSANGFGPIGWRPDVMDDREAREVVRRARDEGRLLADAAYEARLAGDDIVYIRDQCGPLERDRPFFIDVVPERSSDLPDNWLDAGYQRVRFSFIENGAFLDEACVAAFPLPDYPVVGARTGQLAEGGGALWRAEFVLNQEPYRAAYETVASREPRARGVFDVHLSDGALIYAKESCGWDDTEAKFFLHVFPDRARDSQDGRGAMEFANMDFEFFLVGGRFDGKCVASIALPDYPVAGVRTGQFGDSGEVWSATFSLQSGTPSSDYESVVSSEPLAHGVFNVHLSDGALIYTKESCDWDDTEAKFFLHVFPDRARDSQDGRGAMEFANMDFEFFLVGGRFDGKCVASIALPDYPVAGVRTGQFGDSGEIWSATFSLQSGTLSSDYESVVSGEPLARGEFDLYLKDAALIYVKDQCEQDDVTHLFYLHIVPERADDLPEARREVGFDNLDFDFFLRGALFDGKCAARIPLPDYRVASIRTGQSAGGEGELWSVDVEMEGAALRP